MSERISSESAIREFYALRDSIYKFNGLGALAVLAFIGGKGAEFGYLVFWTLAVFLVGCVCAMLARTHFVDDAFNGGKLSKSYHFFFYLTAAIALIGSVMSLSVLYEIAAPVKSATANPF